MYLVWINTPINFTFSDDSVFLKKILVGDINSLNLLVVNVVKSVWVPVVSGVPQGTVFGPLLFSLHINDITADIESEIRLFADDCVCYREIKDKEDTLELQRDIDRLGNWAWKWGMRFQPVKCNMMQLTRKHLNKIQVQFSKMWIISNTLV